MIDKILLSCLQLVITYEKNCSTLVGGWRKTIKFYAGSILTYNIHLHNLNIVQVKQKTNVSILYDTSRVRFSCMHRSTARKL